MAWTTPGTAVAGDVLTAAFWNTNVRDNSAATYNKFRYAKRTAVQTYSSVTAGALFDIDDLTISHAVESAGNIVVLQAMVHLVNTTQGNRQVSIVFDAGGTTIDWIGDAAGNRNRVNGAQYQSGSATVQGHQIMGMAVYAPPSTASVTYKVRGVNSANSTLTYQLNQQVDTGINTADFTRPVSAFFLWEIANSAAA